MEVLGNSVTWLTPDHPKLAIGYSSPKQDVPASPYPSSLYFFIKVTCADRSMALRSPLGIITIGHRQARHGRLRRGVPRLSLRVPTPAASI